MSESKLFSHSGRKNAVFFNKKFAICGLRANPLYLKQTLPPIRLFSLVSYNPKHM